MSNQTGNKKSDKTNKSRRELSRNPRFRGLFAVIFFILSIFSFIGYFNAEGAFIGFFVGLIQSLVGPGFFAVPPVLMLCAVILCFHRGRPVRLRVGCALALIVMAGSLAHLFMNTPEYIRGEGMAASLWRDGGSLVSGGFLSGSITELFHWLFHTVGAAIVLICLSAFFLLAAINKTVVGIVDAIKDREPKYTAYPPDNDKPVEPLYMPHNKRNVSGAAARTRRRNIDIPIDYSPDDEEDDKDPYRINPTAETVCKAKLNSKKAGQSDSEELTESVQFESAFSQSGPDAENEDDNKDDAAIDIPLAIPFMEKKSKKRSIVPPPPEGAQLSSVNKADIKDDFSQISFKNPNDDSTYSFPPLNLLSAPVPMAQGDAGDELKTNSFRLESAFSSFGVNVRITNTTRGPAVTRYEAELEAGVKLSKLTGLSDDIALALGTSGVRIAAMPNKISTVGIEVPNKHIRIVNLREILETPAFYKAKPKLTFAIGMDISGEAVVGDVSKMPHMLVAGTTGSGKSVCLNSIIVSILYRAAPEDVRFIMIDPKQVEFKVYTDIPHLLVPVVTDPKRAAGALQWAVFEMTKRYKLFSETNSRDLAGYNSAIKDSAEYQSDEYQKLPQVVIVIDELSDLMMQAGKEVEESIIRVAQMGRAAGIHLIIATQSPRADVITGLMKANIPSRIALKVSSAMESRIILDAGGNADKLVGNGDMLYSPIGTSKPIRLQGTWMSDKECANVVNYIKSGGTAQYSDEVISEIEKASVGKGPGDKSSDSDETDSDYDQLLPQAVNVILETDQASVSMLQRRLKLGYARAARIVDQMEQMGIVGPFEGSKPRAILVSKEEWRQMQGDNSPGPDEYD